ncbi:MAG: glycosyltransferase family 9 protein [Bacteroidota bacterium]
MGQDIRKILVIKLREMGDTIIATAALSVLKHHFPQARIHLACTDTWASLLEGHPHVDRLWPLNRKKKIRLYQNIIPLRRENFDLVINLHASPSSARLAWWVAPRKKIIYSQGIQKLNQGSNISWPPTEGVLNAIERDLAPLRGLIPDLGSQASPLLLVSADLAQLYRDKLSSAPHPRLILGIGASRITKQWPASRFGGLAKQWIEKTKGSVHLPYLESEQSFIDKMHIPSHQRIYLYKNLALNNLAALISQGDFFCGNDSGPKHMAVALGIPSLSIFGPEDPYVWHPYDRKRHPFLYIPELTCRPRQEGIARCSIPICIEKGHTCMQEISLDRVWASLSQLANL